MKRILKKMMSLILVFTLMMGMGTFREGVVKAEETSHIKVHTEKIQEITMTTGDLKQVNLKPIFEDESGHALTFSLDDGDYTNQTKIDGDILYFTHNAEGVYHPTVTATCKDGDTAVATFTINVKKAPEGLPVQYSYNETPANSVTVFLTISSDGLPICGNDEDATPLAHLKVTVPYFDLAEYDLQDFYRYTTENGQGAYSGDTVIERPTALHLYIYALERFYLGIPESACGKGELFNHNEEHYPVLWMSEMGDAYDSSSYVPLNITGSATSLYMQNFWGHDENLMYYRNHVYPLMSPGWGSTADYILLSDGDTIDVGMFTDWNFYHNGGFLKFNKDSYQIKAGVTLKFNVQKFGTSAVAEGGEDGFVITDDSDVAVYDSNWNEIATLSGENGEYEYKFEEGGNYYILAKDVNATTEDARYAPAISDIKVDSSGTNPENPGTDPENPGTDPENPGTDPENPGTDPENPEKPPVVEKEQITDISLEKTAFTYSGRECKPVVMVKDKDGNLLEENKDYVLTYDASLIKVGKVNVTVSMTGNYTGEKTLPFSIRPKGTSISSVKSASKKKMTVKWKAQKTQTTGYQVRYSKKKTMDGSTIKTVKSNKTTSTTIKGLKSKSTQYVQVRTYKKTSTGTMYSSWSGTKKVKVK